MADNRKDETTVLDVIKSHFGIDKMAESRAERRSSDEQDRREQARVNSGSAPAAQTVQPVIKIIDGQNPGTAYAQNEIAFDKKCPSCGGTLAFEPSTGRLACSFCGIEVMLQTAPADPEKGYSLFDLQNNSGRRLKTEEVKIVCSTCGGSFLTGSNAISGLCPYCGSNSIAVSGDATGTLEPSGIIPFKVGKDEAQDIFRQWINGRRFSPEDIARDSQITDLTGVYVPYWVFDCDIYSPYEGKFGIFGKGEDSYTKYHISAGTCRMDVRDLTFVASDRLENDPFWKAVSTFDMSAILKYDPDRLAGFWSESYTVDGTAAWQKACGKIYDRLRKQIKTLEKADVIANIDMQPQASNISAKYILAPVWITSFDYHGTLYRVLINGQTGNIVGKWPKSYKKLVPLFILIGAILLLSLYVFLRIYPYYL